MEKLSRSICIGKQCTLRLTLQVHVVVLTLRSLFILAYSYSFMLVILFTEPEQAKTVDVNGSDTHRKYSSLKEAEQQVLMLLFLLVGSHKCTCSSQILFVSPLYRVSTKEQRF